MLKAIWVAFLIGASVLLLPSTAAQAQATRTWVSGVGDDANPCSRTAPCKTFAGAISKTATNGEISVLDPGGFGAVTITKSISIVAEGAEGGVLAAATNGIIINAGATGVVNLQGLVIEGAGTGLNGIRVLSAGNVFIRNCIIRGFQAGTGLGIDIEPNSLSRVFVTDTAISKNIGGILAKPAAGGTARVVLDRVHVVNHTGIALNSDGANSSMFVNNSNISFNATGFQAINGGAVNSFGNNATAGNVNGLNPTGTTALK